MIGYRATHGQNPAAPRAFRLGGLEHGEQLVVIELCRHTQEQSIGPGPAGKLKLFPTQTLARELDLTIVPVEPYLLAALRIRVQPLASHSVVINLETVGCTGCRSASGLLRKATVS